MTWATRTSTRMTSFLTRPRVKALGSMSRTILLLPLLIACHPEARTDNSGIRILTILDSVSGPAGDSGPGQKLKAACKAWNLDKSQVVHFFTLSKEYPESQQRTFNWLPCSIKGTLVASNEIWDFEINAASTATWRRQDQYKYWGCSDKECAALVLLMPDGNDP